MKERRRGCLMGLGVAALAADAVLGRALWLPLVGRFLVVSDPLQPADALVPLAGNVDRVVYAAALFGQGYGEWFVATNTEVRTPGIRASYAELVRQEALWQGVPEEAIVLVEPLAETTVDEVEAVRALAAERGWRSVLFVTDGYHTRRARMIARRAFRGSGIEFSVCAVPDAYRPEAWWKSVAGLRETWTEYMKLATYLLGYR